MNARKIGPVIGLAAALVLTGTGVATASAPARAGDPCSKVSPTCTPADVAKAKAAKREAKKEFLDGRSGSAPERSDRYGKDEPGKGPTEAALAKALAAELGAGYDRALKAAKEIDALSKKGRLNTDSAELATVAKGLGVSPKRLINALVNFKRAFAESEGEVNQG